MSALSARLAAHLGALPGGVGCRHLARDRDGLESSALVALGLVRPIPSRVPRCAEHGCPLLDRCPHAADFEPGASGNKAGVKYRPTEEGLVAAAAPNLILARATDLPAAREIVALLAAGPRTIFALHATLLERARREVARGEAADVPGLDRVTLGATLALLSEVGVVRTAADGVTYALAENGGARGDTAIGD